MTPAISLRRASFGYGGHPVVDEVDLDVQPGESVGLLGPNGSGKTTLIKGLLGLTERLGGTIEIEGRPLTTRTRAEIGYVPQRQTVSDAVSATVAEVVMVGRLPHLGLLGRPRSEDREAVHEALELVRMCSRAGRRLGELSGGQQRRVLVARALAARPKVLLMDEPTAGVDIDNQRLLAEVMIELREAGVTLMTVTHDIDVLSPALTRLVRLHGGHVESDRPNRAAEPIHA